MSTTAITITRPRDWFGRWRKLHVRLDGARVGALRIGQDIELAVEPGLHTIQVEMDWCTSAVVTVDAERGGRYAFRTASPGPFRGLRKMHKEPGAFFELVPEGRPE